MPVAGLVLSLSEDVDLRRGALAALLSEPRVTVGDPAGALLPIVTETDDIPTQDALWAEIENTPGVTAVALVSLDFEDVETFDVPASRLRRARPAMEE